MHTELQAFLAEYIPALEKKGISIVSQKLLPYGVQLHLSRMGESNSINIYYSEKCGISMVPGGKVDTGLYKDIGSKFSIQSGSQAPEAAMHSWQSWIGSDECGKGDYMGGLVVCAFAMEQSLSKHLRALGVQDSKALGDAKIIEIAKALYRYYPSRISCLILKPAKYNELYSSMQAQGKNLNDLLAWQHCTAIRDLLNTNPDVQGVLVDQFSNSKKVAAALKKHQPQLPVTERPKAESDTAVAAASIIARYQFLQMREGLKKYYSIEIPLGAGKRVNEAAKKFVAKYGKDRLHEIVKLHFVSTYEVLGLPAPAKTGFVFRHKR